MNGLGCSWRAGAWDERLIHSFAVTYIFGVFHIVYCAEAEAYPIPYQIGAAYRTGDPFGSYTKLLTNPIIDYSPDSCYFPSMVEDAERFLIYYYATGATGLIGTIP